MNALGRPITGHKRPVIGRLLYLKRLKTGYNVRFSDVSDVSDQNRFGTGSEPVPNRKEDQEDHKHLKTGYNVWFSNVGTSDNRILEVD